MKISKKKILNQMQAVTPIGKSNPDAAFSLALNTRPDQLIFVTSQAFDAAQVEALENILAERPVLRLDIILLNEHVEEMATLASDNQGDYISLPETQLKKWLDDAE